MVEDEKKVTLKIPKVNPWMLSTIALAILALILVTGWPISLTGRVIETTALTKEQAGQKAIDYINQRWPDVRASLVSVEDIGEIYKVVTSSQDQQIPVYVTKDGRFLILQQGMIDMTEEFEKPEDWSLFKTSLPDELKNKILGFTYEQPVQVDNRVQEFKNYKECEGNIIVFYYEGCGWCKKYYPVLVEAKEDYPSIIFYTLDLGENKDIGDKFGVSGTPATVINCKYFVGGYLSKESLYPIIDKYAK